MKVEVIEPHGFCAGVTHAVKCALAALRDEGEEGGGGRLYCLHELVHNELVVEDLKGRGMVFVEALEEVPEGARVLFSAHGVAPKVREDAAARKLEVLDATCPFVGRVHDDVRRYAAEGAKVVIIGHRNHAETIGTAGEMPNAADVVAIASVEEVDAIPFDVAAKVGVAVQTTMNQDEIAPVLDALKKRFANLEICASAGVCRATKERQDAVRKFVEGAVPRKTGVLVLGSANSSNTRRLEEIAKASGACWSARAGSLRDIEGLQIPPLDVLGITSGASTPETFLRAAIQVLAKLERPGGLISGEGFDIIAP